jgi:transposase
VWVAHHLAERGLVKGECVGVDASTMEANAALRAIVRRGSGEGYREMLTRMAADLAVPHQVVMLLDHRRAGDRVAEGVATLEAQPAT